MKDFNWIRFFPLKVIRFRTFWNYWYAYRKIMIFCRCPQKRFLPYGEGGHDRNKEIVSLDVCVWVGAILSSTVFTSKLSHAVILYIDELIKRQATEGLELKLFFLVVFYHNVFTMARKFKSNWFAMHWLSLYRFNDST